MIDTGLLSIEDTGQQPLTSACTCKHVHMCPKDLHTHTHLYTHLYTHTHTFMIIFKERKNREYHAKISALVRIFFLPGNSVTSLSFLLVKLGTFQIQWNESDALLRRS